MPRPTAPSKPRVTSNAPMASMPPRCATTASTARRATNIVKPGISTRRSLSMCAVRDRYSPRPRRRGPQPTNRAARGSCRRSNRTEMTGASAYANGEAWAQAQDAVDPLAAFRGEFLIPAHAQGEQVYFCGNSLGLQPRATRDALNAELDYWGSLAVEGHFRGKLPWMDYHEFVREHLAELVGAQPAEVVAMNSLSANLHLLMVSFYRPTRERPAILIEKGAFPSDRYAVESQVRFHGFDPATDLIELDGDETNGAISDASIARALDEYG